MANSDYTKRGNGPLCTTALLVGAVTELQTSVTITLLDSAGTVSRFVGMAAMIDDEIVRVDAYTDTTLTLARGCADTIPAKHLDGAVVWFFERAVGTDSREYVAGETVAVKVLPYTPSRESLAIEKSPPQALTFNKRFSRPYPPGNFKIDGNVWTEPCLLNTAHPKLVLTWAHRDRLLQADALVDHTTSSIGPEPGVTYRLRMFDDSNALLKTRSFTGTSFEYTSAMGTEDFSVVSGAALDGYYALFDAVRAGDGSFQSYRINFVGEGTSGAGLTGLGQTLGNNLGGGGVFIPPVGTEPGEPTGLNYSITWLQPSFGTYSKVIAVDGDYVMLAGTYGFASNKHLHRLDSLGGWVSYGSDVTNTPQTTALMYFDDKIYLGVSDVDTGGAFDSATLISFNKTTLGAIATWPGSQDGDLQFDICNDGTNVWVTEHYSKNLVKIDADAMVTLSSYHIDEGVNEAQDRLRGVSHDSGYLYFHSLRSIYRWSVLGFQSYRIDKGCTEMLLKSGKLYAVSSDGIRIYDASTGVQINLIPYSAGTMEFSSIEKPLDMGSEVWIRHDEVPVVGPYAGVSRARFIIFNATTGVEISRGNNRPGFLSVVNALSGTLFLNDLNATSGELKVAACTVSTIDAAMTFNGAIQEAASPPRSASRSLYLIGIANPITGITSPIPSGVTLSLVFEGSAVVSDTTTYSISSSSAIGNLVTKVNDSANPTVENWIVSGGSSYSGWLAEAQGPLGVDRLLGGSATGDFTVPISKLSSGVSGSVTPIPQTTFHTLNKSLASTITPGTQVTLTLAGVPYTVTSISGSNKDTLGAALVALINAGGVYSAAASPGWGGNYYTYGFTVTSLTGNLPYTFVHSIT